jgi:uncharacterized protein YjdB
MKINIRKHLLILFSLIVLAFVVIWGRSLNYVEGAASDVFWFTFNSAKVSTGSEIELLSESNALNVESQTGFELGTGDTIEWYSSAPSVITITPTANQMIVNLNRQGPGYSTVTAIITKSGITYTISCQVKVAYNIDYILTGTIEATTTQEKVVQMNDGDTKQVRLIYTNNIHVAIGNIAVSWESEDPSVATVDKDGKITAVGSGMTTINVTTNTVSSASAPQQKSLTVVVSPKAIDNTITTTDKWSSDFIITSNASDVFIDTNATYATNLHWKVYDSKYQLISSSDQSKLEYTASSISGRFTISNAKAGVYYIYAFVDEKYATTGSVIDYLKVELRVPITMEDSSIVMNVGDTYNILNNSNIPSLDTFNYATSNATIAEVYNSTGVITAKSKGNATITLTVPTTISNELKLTNNTFTINVTVIDGIALNYTTAKMFTSGTLMLQAITSDPTKEIVWSTSDASIATVEEGIVKGLKEGIVTITASQTINGVKKSATCIINVQQSVDTITIDPSQVSLNVEEFKTLKANITPAGLSNVSLKWTTSNENVVAITDAGDLTATIQGVAGGSAVITAINQDNVVVGYCHVTVKEKVTGIILSETSVNVKQSLKNFQIRATVTPEAAQNKKIIWTTTNPKVITVDSTGKVTLVGAGTASIIATSEDNPLITAICNVTVEVPVAALTLDETTKTMYVGDTTRLSYLITPTNATTKTITWSSSNTAIVNVDSTGLLSARAVGQAIIIAKTTDGGLIATCTITVKQAASGVSLDVKDLELEVGQSYTIKPTFTPANSTEVQITWESTDTSIATVDGNGKVTGVSSGKAVIMAKPKAGGTVYCNVTVVQPATGIQLNYTEKTVVIGEKFKIKATVVPSSAASDTEITWSSSNTKVATVSQKGNVTAKSGGTAIITAKTKDGKFTEFCIVHAVELVTKIKLNKTSYKLGLNKTYTLKATIETNSATNPKVKWTSNNPKVATVDSKGKVTGKSLGYATITATAQDGSKVSASSEIRVVRLATSIKLNKTMVNTVVGRSFTLKATVKPSNATYKKAKWSSSDESIAIVDSDGVVTALKPGSVTIKAKAKDSSGKFATCYVIVQAQTPATSVTILNQNLTMVVGETNILQKAINPIASTDRFTWESDNKVVASVDRSTGKVTALTPGIANITVMTESGKTATTKVTVVGLNTTELVLEQYSTYRLSVVGVTAGITWDVDDSEIAVVNNGLVSSRRVGTTTVTAIVNGRRLTCRVRVVKIK